MSPTAQLLQNSILPLTGAPGDFDALMAKARGKKVVLLGEASHGTHEFYRIRAEITKRLIREQGFNAVAVEADWPDAHRINQYVRGRGKDTEAVDSLGGFKRFPQWMWRNTDVLDFVGWLKNWNESVTDRERKGLVSGIFQAGFYGLDLYSLNASITAVLDYLRDMDPNAAKRVAVRYGCFEHYGSDTQRYGMLAGSGMSEDCKRDVLAALLELHGKKAELLKRDGTIASGCGDRDHPG
ncbi:MAG: erythromycin esterase family protein [Chthoniobacterales bacterium]